MAIVADDGADLLPASDTLKTKVMHQPGDRAPRGGPTAGWGGTVLGGVVGARRDLQSVAGQDFADRLDSEHLPVGVDERYERFDGRSSSAAKKAEAALRISFARRSSAFSAFSRLISAASSEVTPGRWPVSTSALRTQVRTVSAEPMPSLTATAFIAAHSVG